MSTPIQPYLPFDTELSIFVGRFRHWVCSHFTPLDRADACDNRTNPAELASAVRPWVKELQSLYQHGHAQFISPQNACALGCLFALVLSQTESHYRNHGLDPAEVMLALNPIDEILTALSLVEYGILAPNGSTPTMNSLIRSCTLPREVC